jgi:hypothetical protein
LISGSCQAAEIAIESCRLPSIGTNNGVHIYFGCTYKTLKNKTLKDKTSNYNTPNVKTSTITKRRQLQNVESHKVDNYKKWSVSYSKTSQIRNTDSFSSVQVKRVYCI